MFPVNFVIGAAVGAAATYICKDESTKQRLAETTDKLKESLSSVTSVFQKKSDADTQDVNAVAEVVVEEVTEKAEPAKKAATTDSVVEDAQVTPKA